ncbi:hypothetical protein D7Y23_36800 [Corallococcus sp. AB050B]|nr:hypothetical protein D7Y23_36800 [Corallococcus sp. AB050B]
MFLAAGQESTVTLTVRAPANLLPSLLSEVTVTASSGGAPGVSASARAKTYTPPPPPVTGVATTTAILTPAANASVTIGQATLLSARVRNASTNAVVTGPLRGVVTFFVAGVAIGADDDADGDGVFSLPWSIATDTWTATGAQDSRAVYSGVTLQPNAQNLLGSTAAGVVTLTARVTDALSGIKNVAFTRDGSGIRAGTLQSNGNWTAELDTRELLDGTHTVDVWMTDAVDNFVIQSFSFTVKNH